VNPTISRVLEDSFAQEKYKLLFPPKPKGFYVATEITLRQGLLFLFLLNILRKCTVWIKIPAKHAKI
jgi:hypothetical protein